MTSVQIFYFFGIGQNMTEFVCPEAVAFNDRTRVKPIWSNRFTGQVCAPLMQFFFECTPKHCPLSSNTHSCLSHRTSWRQDKWGRINLELDLSRYIYVLSQLCTHILAVSVSEWLLYMLYSRRSHRRKKKAQDQLGQELDRLRYFSFSKGNLNITHSLITLYLTGTLSDCLLLLHKSWCHRRHRGVKMNWHWDQFALSWNQQPRLFNGWYFENRLCQHIFQFTEAAARAASEALQWRGRDSSSETEKQPSKRSKTLKEKHK